MSGIWKSFVNFVNFTYLTQSECVGEKPFHCLPCAQTIKFITEHCVLYMHSHIICFETWKLLNFGLNVNCNLHIGVCVNNCRRLFWCIRLHECYLTRDK